MNPLPTFGWRRLFASRTSSLVHGGIADSLSARRSKIRPAMLILAIGAFASSAANADLNVLQVVPLTGPFGGIGWHMQLGAQVCFAEFNAKGGVAGQRLKLITVNQEGNDIAKQVRGLLPQTQPVALFGLLGEDSVNRLLQDKVLDDNGLPLLGARVGTSQLAGASPQLFLTRAGFEKEIQRIYKHYSISGIKNVGLVYEDDGFGTEVLTHAQKQAQEYGIKLTIKAYLAGSALVDDAVTVMLKAQPQAVILASQTAGAAAFVERYRLQSGPALITTMSYVEGGHLAKIIGTAPARGVSVLEVAPNTLNESVPLVRDFRSAYKKFGPADVDATQAMMESYVAARTLIEGLKRAGGSKSKLASSLAAFDNVDLGGVAVRFVGNRRVGVDYADLAVIDRNGRVIR